MAGSLLANPVQQSHVEAELVSEVKSIQPGQSFFVALRLKMEEGWHTYYKDPGDSGLPTKIQWTFPEGFQAGEILWPRPEKIEIPPIVDYGYHNEVFLLTQIKAPKNLPVGKEAILNAKASWLACKDICIPGEANLTLQLPVENEFPQFTEWKPQFDKTLKQIVYENLYTQSPPPKIDMPKKTFWSYLFFAFLGGLILNLMPCVFPVLSIKILSFVRQAGEDKRLMRSHGLIFAFGVIVSFWILASILIGLRSTGMALGWGFQLQSPRFVAFIILVLFALSLSLFSVFEIGSSLMSLGYRKQGTKWSDSFFSGVLATIVATPCTAPFMGVALAFALTQPPLISLMVFTALGIGLATPYVVLSSSPALLRWIPKPGEWMESFRQAMAFPLLAAVAWLVWVIGWQTGNNGVILMLIALILTAMAAWIYGRWTLPHRSAKVRMIASMISLTLFAFILGLAWNIGNINSPQRTNEKISFFGITWEPFSPEKIKQWRAQGKPIFIDFTAAWCATCQVNKALVFRSGEVKRKFDELGVIPVEADWTNRDPVITRALESYGRTGVPLYVLYTGDPSAPPVILPEVINANIVLNALDKISKTQNQNSQLEVKQ